MPTRGAELVRKQRVPGALSETGRSDLEAVYRASGAELWRSVYAYTGGVREVTDDAVAEAFAQTGRRIDQIRDLRSWLFRAAFRIAAGELKRRGSTAHRQAVAGEGPGAPDEPGYTS